MSELKNNYTSYLQSQSAVKDYLSEKDTEFNMNILSENIKRKGNKNTKNNKQNNNKKNNLFK